MTAEHWNFLCCKKIGVNYLTDVVVRVTSYRELAYQIAEQFRVLGKPLGLRDCIIVGGMGKTATTENWSGQGCWCEDAPASFTAGYQSQLDSAHHADSPAVCQQTW